VTLQHFAVERPTTIAEALEVIGDDAIPYSGGTELLIAMKMGLIAPAVLVDLKRVTDFRAIRIEGEHLVIGAGASHAEIAASPLVERHAPLLREVERGVGNARVRAQGSIGGNICFAEPRSDIATVLIALDATLRLQSSDSTRQLDVSDFLQGAYATDRREDELLVDILIPVGAPAGGYVKFQTAERPTVGVAAVVSESTGCRVVVGAVGETPLAFDFDSLSAVAPDAIAESIEPIADLTGSVRYKRHVTATYVRRLVEKLRTGGHVG
jgi:carbon-monoxide dehydrogenase medium subunit